MVRKAWQKARDVVFPGLAAALLLVQMAAIARKPFVEERFFCWSPHDSRTDMKISATRDGVAVAAGDVERRYGLPVLDWHSVGNVKRVIETAESRLPEDRWRVRLEYQRNLSSPRVWTYP